MKRFIPVLLSFVCLFPNLNAQDNFPGCPGHFTVINPEAGGPSNLSNVNPADISQTLIGNTGVELNGLAFNSIDNYLYAMSDPALTGAPALYRLNSAAVPTLITTINQPPGIAGAVISFVGDIDQNGTYYFPAVGLNTLIPISYTLYLGKLDLTLPLSGMPSVTPVYVPLTLDATCQSILDGYITAFITSILVGSPVPSGGIQDWAFNPTDVQLWSYLAVESTVLKLDPVTASAVCYPTTNPSLTEFGGIFFDQAGLMYGFEVDAGNTYKVDISGCPGLACATLTPGLGFAANSRGDAASCPWPTIPLSVELVEFEAHKNGSGVLLNWTTASETDNRHFVIQKSTDGVAFQNIGTVQGAGDSREVLYYDFKDDHPFSGLNYYRLQQEDFDGRTSYSPVRVIDYSDQNTLDVSIYPNPATEWMTISLSEVFEASVRLEIINMIGQQQKVITLDANQISVSIKVDDLPEGKYFLRITNGEFIATRSFVIFSKP